jgi:uroporphyrin-III C-methyltransferase / precorrin-2 dehydrogenase / sirohydrochlorin ferrochelatase
MHMNPLARLPAFFALQGKRTVVAGNGPAAAWKAELLSAAGARVDFFSRRPPEEIRAVAASPPAGAITVHERDWQPADFTGAAIAVGECADDSEAARFATGARAAGVPVNVIDRPAFCDFAFGAIVNRSPLVIGISTDGAAPVFGQAIRAKIETLIPTGFARWAEAARNWRPRVQALALPFRGRRNFWERFTDRAIAAPDSEPTEAVLAALLKPAETPGSGAVVIVQAGSRDADLLTLRAVRALQSADVILFDETVSAEILDFARREARKMLVAKSGPSLTVSLANAGRRVVRLTSGEVSSAKEIAACGAAGIKAELVPGVATPPAAEEFSAGFPRVARR